MAGEPAKKQRRRLPGCVIALGVLVLAPIAFQGFRLVQLWVNEKIWGSRQPERYTLVPNYVVFGPIPPLDPITVDHGRAVYADGTECPDTHCMFLPDYMFEKAQGCILQFPRSACSVTYDPVYGFPSRIETSCLIMTDYYERTEIVAFTPSESTP